MSDSLIEISSKFRDVLGRLEAFQFIIDNKLDVDKRKFAISQSELVAAGWYASIYASSKIERIQGLAQKFAALLLYQFAEDPQAVKLSYIILSRVGNLMASSYHKSLYIDNSINLIDRQFKQSFGALLDIEISDKRDVNQINSEGANFLVTDFQKKLWLELMENNDVSISAPTSSGKSFILQHYIKEKLRQNKKFKVLYIVPTKALISQVSDKFRQELENVVDVKTAYVEREPMRGVTVIPNKEIYVVTPERCLKLIERGQIGEYKPDFVFVDEIQNIESNNTRGVLFEYVLQQIKSLWDHAKVVTAGPYISQGGELFEKIFYSTPLIAETSLSPVSQLKTIIALDNSNNISVILNKEEDNIINVSTSLNFDKLFSKSIGVGFAELLNLFGKNGPNLIYSPKTNLAESWALACARQIKSTGIIPLIDGEIQRLIDFIKKEIHEKYYLVECLTFGVAFHHGKLPEVVRREVENLFSDKKIKYLFCTSTLLQGVNLPALNMFIDVPKKLEEKMSQFEFGNLIGRAGRFSESLYGTIYAVRRNRYTTNGELQEDWTKEYVNSEFNKKVEPATEFVIQTHFDKILSSIDLSANSLEFREIEDTLIFIRHKYIQGEEVLQNYLVKKKVDVEKINEIIRGLNKSLGELSVSYETLRKNPSIDPKIQNELSKSIDKEGVEKWVIHPNGRLFERMKRENTIDADPKTLPLFYQLELIMQNLDGFMRFQYESWRKNQISMSVTQMVLYGIKWLDNKSYGEIIKNDINWYANHENPNKRIDPENPKHINHRINENIKINGTIVTFVLARNLKLLNDILKSKMSEDQLEKYKFSLALPMMLELGTREPVVMELISKGIPRAIAIAIFKIIPENAQDFPFDWLMKQSQIKIHPVYSSYLKRVGIL